MDKTVPNYLKVLRVEESDEATSLASRSSSQRFWQAFSEATGWRVDAGHRTDNGRTKPVRVLPAVAMDVMAGDPGEASPAVEKSNATELAQVASDMSHEIERLQATVRKQEVELAALSTAPYNSGDVQATCDGIESTLRDTVLALGFDSAVIYMLDDDTQFLNPRVVYGLPDEKLSAPPRQLRGSRADLEAMVQEVVLMENLQGDLAMTWNAPEDAGAAICAAIFKGDLPVGTLWLYAADPTKLNQSHAAIARLASKQVSLSLSAAIQSRAQLSSKQSVEAVGDISAWQFSSLPSTNHLAEGWFVDGMIESPNQWSIGWHTWDVLPDGTLMIAIAEAVDQHAAGVMVAATARAGLCAHSGYRHSPKQILQRVSDTLWQTNTADQLLSLMYLRLDPESGEGDVAVGGQIEGLIAGDYGYRPLVASGCRPLASAIDIDCFESTFRLSVGERLLAYTAGLRNDGISQDLLGCCYEPPIRMQRVHSRFYVDKSRISQHEMNVELYS